MGELELSSHVMSIINWDLYQKIKDKKRRLKMTDGIEQLSVLKIKKVRDISLLEILILLNNE